MKVDTIEILHKTHRLKASIWSLFFRLRIDLGNTSLHQKISFPLRIFFSKFEQIRRKLHICSKKIINGKLHILCSVRVLIPL